MSYLAIGRRLASHEAVNHSEEEWARTLAVGTYVNSAEEFFSIFKRGITALPASIGAAMSATFTATLPSSISGTAIRLRSALTTFNALTARFAACEVSDCYRTVNRQTSETVVP
jgi:hypothetical protein